MVCQSQPKPPVAETPHSDLAAFVVERNYAEIGCNRWNSRKVQLLCGKFGETVPVMAARMRLRPSDLIRRLETDCWTKQDGLILTILEREIDALRGGVLPRPIVTQATQAPT